MKHSHPLTLNGGSGPSQFILAHEHDRGDEPHEHDVTPDGKTATSTRYSGIFKTLDPVDGPSKAVDMRPEPVDVARNAARQLLVHATSQGVINDEDWQESTDGQFFLVNFGTGDGVEEYTAADVVARLKNPEFFAQLQAKPKKPDTQFDNAQLRKHLDECVRALNNLVVAHVKNGLDMPAGVWKAVEDADRLVNSARDAIPTRTVVRYPAWIDVTVDTRAEDDHTIVKSVALAQQGDAGSFGPNTRPYVTEAEDQDLADAALRYTEISVWPDPKLEG